MQAYQQVYQSLREQIFGGHFAAGQKFLTENDISERFGVSRITTRHALRLLEEQGLLDRYAGKGTFVKAIRAKKLPFLNNDFTGSVRKLAPGLTRTLIKKQYIHPSEEIANQLGISKPSQCLYAERLDMLGNEPLAYDRVYISMQVVDAIDDAMLGRVDFLEAWTTAQKIIISHAHESIEAFEADSYTAQILNVVPRCAMLMATDVLYTTANSAVAIFESVYRGDRIKLIAVSTKDNHVKTAY